MCQGAGWQETGSFTVLTLGRQKLVAMGLGLLSYEQDELTIYNVETCPQGNGTKDFYTYNLSINVP